VFFYQSIFALFFLANLAMVCPLNFLFGNYTQARFVRGRKGEAMTRGNGEIKDSITAVDQLKEAP